MSGVGDENGVGGVDDEEQGKNGKSNQASSTEDENRKLRDKICEMEEEIRLLRKRAEDNGDVQGTINKPSDRKKILSKREGRPPSPLPPIPPDSLTEATRAGLSSSLSPKSRLFRGMSQILSQNQKRNSRKIRYTPISSDNGKAETDEDSNDDIDENDADIPTSTSDTSDRLSSSSKLHHRHVIHHEPMTDLEMSTIVNGETSSTNDSPINSVPVTSTAALLNTSSQGSNRLRKIFFQRKSKGSDHGSYLGDENQTPNAENDADHNSTNEENRQEDVTDVVVPASPVDDIPFGKVVFDRAVWLVGLLVLQSCSSFILERNEALLQSHLVIVNFLTMLVGAGGNAGNQASVRVIRGLAVGTLNDNTIKWFLLCEFKIALCLSTLLSLAGFLRALVFLTPMPETIAITASLYMIVSISIGLGSLLPLAMKFCGIDPAHSSTTIQVLMDILGVTITVHMSALVLKTGFGETIKSLFS